MRKRLRRKLRRGGVRELGFRVRFRLPEGTPEGRLDFLDRFILEAIEGSGLECGGGGAEVWEVTVSAFGGRTSVTEGQRARVLQ